MDCTTRLIEIEHQQDAVLRELDDLNARLEQTLAICQRNLKLVAPPAVSQSSSRIAAETP
jgi:hypothetical protein